MEQLIFTGLEEISLDTDICIYKSHNLIESGYNFTLNEQRLTYLASKQLKPRYIKSNIKPSEIASLFGHETFKNLRIYVNEFKKEFGLNSTHNLYETLEETAQSLFDKKIQYLEDDGSFVEKRWVITSRYNKEGKYVELTFHPDLVMDLLVLKGSYGKMNFEATTKFRSAYTFRIYELLQNYAYKGKRSFKLEDLRYKLGIYDDKKYNRFSDFKKYVLTPSVKSINDQTDLYVEFDPIKQGRTTTGVEFKIKRIKSKMIDNYSNVDLPDISQVQQMNNLTHMEMTAGQVAELTDLAILSIKTHNIDMSFYDYITYCVERVNEYARTHDITNMYGCLKKAIEEYWQPTVSIDKTEAPTRFHNFEGRKYDYNELEKQLLEANDIYAK